MATTFRSRHNVNSWCALVYRWVVTCVLLFLALSPTLTKAEDSGIYYACPYFSPNEHVEIHIETGKEIEGLIVNTCLNSGNMGVFFLPNVTKSTDGTVYFDPGAVVLGRKPSSNGNLDANVASTWRTGSNVIVYIRPNTIIPLLKRDDVDPRFWIWLSYQKVEGDDNSLDGLYVYTTLFVYSLNFGVYDYRFSGGADGIVDNTNKNGLLVPNGATDIYSEKYGNELLHANRRVEYTYGGVQYIYKSNEYNIYRYTLRSYDYTHGQIRVTNGEASVVFGSSDFTFPLELGNSEFFSWRYGGNYKFSGSCLLGKSGADELEEAVALARGRVYGSLYKTSGEGQSTLDRLSLDEVLTLINKEDTDKFPSYLIEFTRDITNHDTDNGGEADISEFVNKHDPFNPSDDVSTLVPPTPPDSDPKSPEDLNTDGQLVELDKESIDWLKYLHEKDQFENKKSLRELIGNPDDEKEYDPDEPDYPEYLQLTLPEDESINVPYQPEDFGGLGSIDFDNESADTKQSEVISDLTNMVESLDQYRLLRELLLPLDQGDWPVYVLDFDSGLLSSNIPCDLYSSSTLTSSTSVQSYSANTLKYTASGLSGVEIPEFIKTVVLDFNILAQERFLKYVKLARNILALFVNLLIARKLLLIMFKVA